MANISVRRESEERPPSVLSPLQYSWDPGRWVRDLVGWDPFREMVPYIPGGSSNFLPAFEVKETKHAYVFKADVPGVKEADLELQITGNRLTISGKRESEKSEQTDAFFAYERSYGEFSRSFTLPEGVDTSAVQADLKDGVLTVSVPKRPELQPKRIAIHSGKKS